MATKRNDTKGYERGARGIDTTKGCGWQEDHVDKGAQAAIYGRSWWGQDGKGDITSPSLSKNNSQGGHSVEQLIKGAKGKWKP